MEPPTREDEIHREEGAGEARNGFRERYLGRSAAFLLPSLKLKQPPRQSDSSIESRLHDFLMKHFGGYTAQAGNIFGYWRDEDGRDSYGEHREFTVAIDSASALTVLKEYLANLSHELAEECIYLRSGEQTVLIYPGNSPESR
ncbi:MAG TPA: hypothetical protein VEX68_01295 [Bryobacteraceae bacterium]|nr:hypothetical protein [Bryobacteraceae bacterium]